MVRALLRGISVAAIAALAAASLPAPTAAQEVTVRINGQPLYLSPGPIERAGRVFVPLRGIFERLGAAVVYASGEINATKGSTTVALRIGSTQAVVNGQSQTLDVAPFIVGATTYVPLRFIAQSLGAEVGYSDSTRVVSIQMAQGVPPPVRPVRPPPVQPPYPPPNPAPVVGFRAQQPQPGAVIQDRFRVISAQFTYSVQPGSVRVLLDGNDVTYRSGVSATGFSYKPPAPLDFGSHTVRVFGRGPGARPFDRSWSFSVARSGLPLTIYQPAPNAPVGQTFTLTGNTVSNGRIRVTAGATPSFTGEFDGRTTAGPKGNFNLTITLTTMPGQQAVSVRVTATDPRTSQSTQAMLQLRLTMR